MNHDKKLNGPIFLSSGRISLTSLLAVSEAKRHELISCGYYGAGWHRKLMGKAYRDRKKICNLLVITTHWLEPALIKTAVSKSLTIML